MKLHTSRTFIIYSTLKQFFSFRIVFLSVNHIMYSDDDMFVSYNMQWMRKSLQYSFLQKPVFLHRFILVYIDNKIKRVPLNWFSYYYITVNVFFFFCFLNFKKFNDTAGKFGLVTKTLTLSIRIQNLQVQILLRRIYFNKKII